VNQQRQVEVTPAPNALKLKVGGQSGGIDRISLAKAEKALMDLAKTVDRLVEAEVSKLEAVRDRIHVEGYNSETAQILAIRVKDLKGLTEAHGYALVAAIAKSLCGVIDDPRARLLDPVAMLDTHTAFLRAAVERNIRGLGDPAGEALLSKLETHVRSHHA
jgi:hypothetical protein